MKTDTYMKKNIFFFENGKTSNKILDTLFWVKEEELESKQVKKLITFYSVCEGNRTKKSF